MSAADRKKALRKAKKAELKKAQEPSDTKSKDEDPNGEKYLEGDFMSAAMTFVSPLLQFSRNCIRSQVLGAAVYTRRSKFSSTLTSREISFGIEMP
jgi:peptide alpha-N-acetyltransferase